VVDGLIKRLGLEQDPARRRGLLSALCRLHFIEGEWKGDSWGTRPDTRGPYYQPDPWAGSATVLAALKDILAHAAGDETAFLVDEMNRNRIKSDEALKRILSLAKQDPAHIPAVTGQLASADDIPAEAVPLLIQAASMENAAANTYMQAVMALAKVNSAEGLVASFTALARIKKISGTERELNLAQSALLNSPHLEHQVAALVEVANGKENADMAEGILLKLAVDKNRSVETRSLANKAVDDLWVDSKKRERLLKAIAKDRLGGHAERVLLALNDSDKNVKKAAEEASNRLGLDKQAADTSAKLHTMKREDVLAAILKAKGDVSLGEQLFARQTCIACHTTSEDQPAKGPYLGNIAQTYKRVELAENILDPNKTVAQGFITNLISLKDGSQHMGFITFESADKLTIRNLAAQEVSVAVADITNRTQLPQSMMPPGLVDALSVYEFASMLDYLQGLVKK
jgi:putative heme-binding domain-containing protein